MQSDGQSRGSMTYSTTNSLSSGSNATRVHSDRRAAPAPTHRISAPSRDATHRLAQLEAIPHESPAYSPSYFRGMRPSSPGDFHHVQSASTSVTSSNYNNTLHRNLGSPVATDPGHSSYCSPSSGSVYSSAELRAGFATSYGSSISPSRYRSSSSTVSTTSIIRPPNIFPAPTPLGTGLPERQEDERGYSRRYSSRLVVPRTGSSSLTDSGLDPQESFQQRPSPSSNPFSRAQPEYTPAQASTSYSAPHPLPSNISTGSTLAGAVHEPVTGTVNVDVNDQSSPSTVTTTLYMNLNVITERHAEADSPRTRLSSIPMRRGTPPTQSAIFPLSPGVPPTRFQLHHQFPTTPSTHASMSISTHRNALKLKAQVTLSPPAEPRFYPSSPSLQTPKPPTLISKTAQRNTHTVEPQRPFADPVLLQKPVRERVGASLLESRGARRINPSREKKPAKMHMCPECNKVFPRPSGLKTHMNTHNNDKPFACEYLGCPRMFSVKSNAKRHLRTHGVGLTPYSRSDSARSDAAPATTHAKAVRSSSCFIGFEPVIVGSNPAAASGRAHAQNARAKGIHSASGKHTSAVASTLGISDQEEPSYPEPSFFKLRWATPRRTSRLDGVVSGSTNPHGSQVCGGNSHDHGDYLGSFDQIPGVDGPSYHSTPSSRVGSAHENGPVNNWPKTEDPSKM